MMTNEAQRVVYFGGYTDCLFVQTLLQGSGIQASIENFGMGVGWQSDDIRVFVAHSDVERALPLVEDFKRHGQKSW